MLEQHQLSFFDERAAFAWPPLANEPERSYEPRSSLRSPDARRQLHTYHGSPPDDRLFKVVVVIIIIVTNIAVALALERLACV